MQKNSGRQIRREIKGGYLGEKVGKKLGEKMGEKTGEKVGESLGEIHKLKLCQSISRLTRLRKSCYHLKYHCVGIHLAGA